MGFPIGLIFSKKFVHNIIPRYDHVEQELLVRILLKKNYIS